MKNLVMMSVGALMVAVPAMAQTATSPSTGAPMTAPAMTGTAPGMAATSTAPMKMAPAQGVTVTNWYKQNVYDKTNTKVGSIEDVLVNGDGHIDAIVLSVGGFLGMGDKDVIVPFSAVQHTMKDNKSYLSIDASKDILKQATGFKYDSTTTKWIVASN